MALSSQDVGDLIFKQTIRPDLGKLTLDGMSLSILMQFDGKKTLDQVARNLQKNPAALKQVVSELLGAKLIKLVVNRSENTVDREFMGYLVSQLSIAIGPLGKIIVEDGLDILGYTGTTLPANQAAELTDLMSREIPGEAKRIKFKQEMLNKIREKGYL